MYCIGRQFHDNVSTNKHSFFLSAIGQGFYDNVSTNKHSFFLVGYWSTILWQRFDQ